jgi:beta-glucanase (GH16 family)
MEAYPGGDPESGWSDSRFHPTMYGVTIWETPNVPSGDKMIATPDLSAGFHKYGLKWEPDRQTFYFDGNEVYRVSVGMSDLMYILLDLWFGSASGTPDGTTPTGKSNAFEINYVRAWEFK